ncbi:MAG: bifunctional (p)ppGpp synthetase/guanosine-3',5'-bis(diphosphate) 3'-pyrophosphohydrolase [Clostridia bacterium]|nr:bifunctional (p)ppGpp synthetase/guanosine-3',5'-bis(diphosphate) 3'-pyrophosphohydrolase [Clostridia bacterium]
MATINDIIENVKRYNKSSDLDFIMKAYNFANDAHNGQERKSGEPYIIHPVEVAYIITTLELDDAAICAALLHDVVEDTDITKEQLQELFGEEVVTLVEGVTKLGKISAQTFIDNREEQVENYRKFFMAMAKDIRVLMIKLADRLHNMRTLKHLSDDRKKANAKETRMLYAPLANRLGIYSIKWELEDLSFMYLEPEAYFELAKGVKSKRAEREKFINEILDQLRAKMKEMNIQAEIYGRPKHLWSIYRKMQKDNKTLDQIYDLFALRIIVNSVKDCYAALGLVHEMYKPMPRRFKDYIAMPKPNMYQSLHTTLIGNGGAPFEVQIRTWDMHRVVEYGIAAHWAYKEKGASVSVSDDKLSWLRETLEWQKETNDDREFMNKLKFDLFDEEVFVFTPRGDIKSLPAGSVPIDFAYAIHEQVGHKMIGAKVNSRIVPITTVLRNGDIVEIVTSDNSNGPSRDWLKIIKTTSARTKIQNYFKKAQREENTIKGKEMIEKELKRIGMTFTELFKPEWLEKTLEKYKYASLEECYAAIGFGAISPLKIITRLLEEYKKENKDLELEKKIEELKQAKLESKPRSSKSGVIVKGIENCLVKLSKCCNPLPGDEIIGYITKGRGVSIHRADCVNCRNLISNDQRLIDVSWEKEVHASYITDLTVYANDRNGLLADITVALNDAKATLVSMNAKTTPNRVAIITLGVEVDGVEKLTKILKAVRKVDSVYDVHRNK